MHCWVANAGDLLAATPNAAIADYPFTTLHPNLGVVGIDNTEFVMADIPGLIEGAHEGRGLGDLFLGHVEKCAVLLHLIDATDGNFLDNYKTIIHEIAAYGGHLSEKPMIVALNKVDALDDEERAFYKEELEAQSDAEVLLLSAVSGEGCGFRALRRVIKPIPRRKSKMRMTRHGNLRAQNGLLSKIGSALLVPAEAGGCARLALPGQRCCSAQALVWMC